MINLKLEEGHIVKIKSSFSELTLHEFDNVVEVMNNSNGVQDWIELLSILSEPKIDFLDLTVRTYVEIIENFLNESLDEYALNLEFNNRTIKLKNGQLNIKSKQVVQIEGIIKSDKIKYKTATILTILFCGEYNSDFFHLISQENVGRFLKLINLINPINIKTI
tara:strand:- start:824 stop:1315 length:492 start_codon:yes stop_codon:yes gene_type:complete